MQGERNGVVQPFNPIWTAALTDQSGATFRDVATPDVKLEGSIFATPIEGRENVWTTFRTAAGISES